MQSSALKEQLTHKGLGWQLVERVRTLNRKILDLYRAPLGWNLQRKPDSSPVTAADLMAHNFLEKMLLELTPGVPVLSEEGAAVSVQERRSWPLYWLVDPLDGTQEFVNRSDEFSVNVALMFHGRPLLGLVSLPVQDRVYVGIQEQGAYCWEHGAGRSLVPLQAPPRDPILAVSRRRADGKAKALADSLETEAAWCQLGGALKFCEIAEGRAHIYPRFSPVCEWDVAAGHALIASLGAQVYQENGAPLVYNEKNTLEEVFFCACLPEMLGQVLPFWLDILKGD
jgi:3'(2'), 5'-bisphosphate nucleotidase